MPDWRSLVKQGEFVAVALPSKEGAPYGYARIEAAPISEDVLVTLYTTSEPNGQRGTIPTALLVVPLTSEQFQAARNSRWPSSYAAGRALCNQTTVGGIATC